MSKIKSMKIPFYREREIRKLYEVFCDEEKSSDLEYRKAGFYKILKAKFRWINNPEYLEMYKLVRENEMEIAFLAKRGDISQKYRTTLIKLFCAGDTDHNNVLNLDEFKMVMIRFNIMDFGTIREMFVAADLNGDGLLTIDEFIDFLAHEERAELLERMDEILECRQEHIRSIDRRTLLFRDFPGSPLKFMKNWRPSLANLRSPNSIKRII